MIHESILDTIGHTPVVRLQRIAPDHVSLYAKVERLEKALMDARDIEDIEELATFSKDVIIPAMNELRISADELETITAKEYWPYPSYGEILTSVY